MREGFEYVKEGEREGGREGGREVCVCVCGLSDLGGYNVIRAAPRRRFKSSKYLFTSLTHTHTRVHSL